MLKIKGKDPTAEDFEFTLKDIEFESPQRIYKLHNPLLGYSSDFSFSVFTIYNEVYPDLTASIYFFKNQHFLSKDIIELRIKHNGINNQIGYFFNLSSIFQNGVLNLNKHLLTAVDAGLQTLFGGNNSFQCKFPNIDDRNIEITHFFDDDLVILILCDQLTAKMQDFNIKNYLAELYLNGFVFFNGESTKHINNNDLIKTNFTNIYQAIRKDGSYSLTLSSINPYIADNAFVITLYDRLISDVHDPLTRFVLLYQVIEILIDRIFKIKIQELVCSKIENLTSYELRQTLPEVNNEGERINWLFNSEFSIIPTNVNATLCHYFKEFFRVTNDTVLANKETLPGLFYAYRNKLVHNYRHLHDTTLNSTDIKSKMDDINNATEIMICEIIRTYKK